MFPHEDRFKKGRGENTLNVVFIYSNALCSIADFSADSMLIYNDIAVGFLHHWIVISYITVFTKFLQEESIIYEKEANYFGRDFLRCLD
jgi:hypothetical protein